MIDRKVMSQCISVDYCHGWNDAVKAMEEEREAGCPFCDEESDEHDYMNGVQTIEGMKVLVVETSKWNNYDDCFDDVRIPVEYCPMCGKCLETKNKNKT